MTIYTDNRTRPSGGFKKSEWKKIFYQESAFGASESIKVNSSEPIRYITVYVENGADPLSLAEVEVYRKCYSLTAIIYFLKCQYRGISKS